MADNSLVDYSSKLKGAKVDLMSTKDIDFHLRQIKNAAPAVDDNDYVILSQLNDAISKVSGNQISTPPPAQIITPPPSGGSVIVPGTDTQIIYNSNGKLGADANFVWNYKTQELVITSTSGNPGLNVINGFIEADGGLKTISTSPNAINALNGQIIGKYLAATEAIQWEGIPTTNAPPIPNVANYATVYYDNTQNQLMVSYNQAPYIPLAGLGGSPGGVYTSVQYKGSNGAFAGDVNFTYDPNNATLSIAEITPTSGVIAPIFNATGTSNGGYAFKTSNDNVIIDINGNVDAFQFISHINMSMQGSTTDPALSGPGYVNLYYNTGSNEILASYNGGPYVPFGSGKSSGPSGYIQFSDGNGGFLSSSNLIWDNANAILTNSGDSHVLGTFYSNMYALQDGGGWVIDDNGNVCFRGGSAIWPITSTPQPKIANYAVTYYDATRNQLLVSYNNGPYIPLGGNSQGLVGCVQYSDGNGGFLGSDNLKYDATNSDLTLTGVNGNSGITAPLFNATNTGTAYVFQSPNVDIDGNGNVSATGLIWANGYTTRSQNWVIDNNGNVCMRGGEGIWPISSIVQPSIANYATVYYDQAQNQLLVSYNNAPYVPLGRAANNLYGCVQYSDGNGNFLGSNNLKYNDSLSILTVASTGGSSGIISPIFNANGSGSAITFKNASGNFTVDNNGNITAVSYSPVGSNWVIDNQGDLCARGGRLAWPSLSSAPATFGSGYAVTYYDSAQNKLLVSYNNGPFVPLGGTYASVGLSGCVQYSDGNGGFLGTNNLKYNDSLSILTVASNGSSSGIISPVFNANISGNSAQYTFQNSDLKFWVDINGQVNTLSYLNTYQGVNIYDRNNNSSSRAWSAYARTNQFAIWSAYTSTDLLYIDGAGGGLYSAGSIYSNNGDISNLGNGNIVAYHGNIYSAGGFIINPSSWYFVIDSSNNHIAAAYWIKIGGNNYKAIDNNFTYYTSNNAWLIDSSGNFCCRGGSVIYPSMTSSSPATYSGYAVMYYNGTQMMVSYNAGAYVPFVKASSGAYGCIQASDGAGNFLSQSGFIYTNNVLQLPSGGKIYTALFQASGDPTYGCYMVGSNTVINNSGTFVGWGVNCPSYGVACAGVNPYVGGVQYNGVGSGQFTSADGHTIQVHGGVITAII